MKLILQLCGVITLALLAFFLWPKTPVASVPAPVPAMALLPVTQAVPAAQVVPPAAAPAPVAPVVALPPAVQHLFPELQGPIGNWRDFNPAEVAITLSPEITVRFTRQDRTTDPVSTTWRGRANGNKQATLVGVGTNDGWDALASLGLSGSYEIHVRGNVVAVKTLERMSACGTDAANIGQSAPVPPASLQALVRNTVSTTGTSPTTGATSAALTSTGPVVDVFFVWDNLTNQDATSIQDGTVDPITGLLHRVPTDPVVLITSTLKARLASSNLMLENSQVNFRWNFAGAVWVPFTATTSKQADYNNIVLSNSAEGVAARAAFAAAKADQLVIVVYGDDKTAQGRGDQPGHFSIVGWTTDDITLAHELGHNFGCGHDRTTDSIPDSNLGYDFGYKLSVPNLTTDTSLIQVYGANASVGTIMSYTNAYAKYFSNPLLKVVGSELVYLPTQQWSVEQNRYNYGWTPLIVNPALFAMGVPQGQPRAADNARVLNEAAAAMAAYQTPDPAVITVQPVSGRNVKSGQAVSLSVTATGSGLNYQWQKNGVDISGATDSTYTISKVALGDAGTYTALVWNSANSLTSSGTRVSVVDNSVPSNARLVNLSARSFVGTGSAVQIAGFVISGSTSKQVLIRASGPALLPFGITNAVTDPTLELHDATSTIASNDDWSSDPVQADLIRNVGAQVGASPWAVGSKDAAIVTTLQPGVYSAICAGKAGGTGVALLEVYEVTTSGPKLVNLSSRTQVGVGENVQIAGIVIGGTTPQTILVRASGPALTQYGVTGVLADPVVELHDTTSTLQVADDWSSDPVAAADIEDMARTVGAAPWVRGTKDAAMLLTLNPGAYSLVVRGKDNATGVALVEVFAAP